MIYPYRRARQGELPEGQEKVPWGTTPARRINRMHIVTNGATTRRALRETFIVIHSYLLPPNSSLE